MATFWPGVPPPQRPALAALTRPMSGESVCGDACAQRTTGGVTSLLLADGLGHGELAAVASREAARAFTAESRDERPARTLERLNGIVRSTRGAAMAVARLDPAAATLTFAGVGNVAGWIDDGDRRHALVSSPGIVGSHTKAIREVESRLPPGAIVVLHSDGLTSKWDLAAYPGLRTRDPRVIAATLIRDAGIRHDDASVMVARAS